MMSGMTASTHTCMGCDTQLTGRTRKCDACKTKCLTCGGELTLYGGDLKCRPCLKLRHATWYSNNKEYVRHRATMKLYGLTSEEAELLRSREVCDVCGENRIGKGLHIDHDHKTGEVRGVLCHGCNLALGNIEDNPERLRALASYLEKSK